MSAQLIPDEIDEFLVERKKVDFKKQLTQIVDTTNALIVDNEAAFRKITSLYAESRNWEKQIETARKKANEPDQERINGRNDKAKELLTPLKQIQFIAKKKAEQYQMILEDLKRQEEEKIKHMIDLIGADEMPYIAPMEKSIRGEGAIVYTRTVRKFRIVDLAKVPLKYLQINEDEVNQDIKLGIAEIPGIEIFSEKTTQLKSR